MAANGYAPSSSFQVVASPGGVTAAITGTTLRIINVGPNIAYVLLATTQAAAAAVKPLTGLAIQPGAPAEFLTVGSNTFLGACSEGQFPARLNVSEGT
jgi:hypothetical protein